MTTLAFGPQEQASARQLIELALREDLGESGDLTSTSLLDSAPQGTVQIVARKTGVLAGGPIVRMVFQQVDPQVQVQIAVEDGAAVRPGEVVGEIRGPVLSLLSGERTALNFLTHLSGIATLTQTYVTAVSNTSARILDTRKTLPGWRILQKYAVRAGGGLNHRIGLFDAVLIKDNHLAVWKEKFPTHTVADAVKTSRRHIPSGTILEVEVDSVVQFRDALQGAPDMVLLDNMTLEQLSECVRIRNAGTRNVLLEASGGVNLETVRQIAATGVDRISIGALTHSAPQLDLAFDWKVA